MKCTKTNIQLTLLKCYWKSSDSGLHLANFTGYLYLCNGRYWFKHPSGYTEVKT